MALNTANHLGVGVEVVAESNGSGYVVTGGTGRGRRGCSVTVVAALRGRVAAGNMARCVNGRAIDDVRTRPGRIVAVCTLVVGLRQRFTACYTVDMAFCTAIQQGIGMGIVLRVVRSCNHMTVGTCRCCRMAIGAALPDSFCTLDMTDGVDVRTVSNVRTGPGAGVAPGTFVVGGRQGFASRYAVHMTVGAVNAAGMFVMILSARTLDVQAVIGSCPVNRQRIPDGLIQTMTEYTVRAGSLGDVADRTVFLHVLGRRLVHGVLRNAKNVNGMTPGTFAPGINRDGVVSCALSGGGIRMTVNTVNRKVAWASALVNGVKHMISPAVTGGTGQVLAGDVLGDKIGLVRVGGGVHGRMALSAVLARRVLQEKALVMIRSVVSCLRSVAARTVRRGLGIVRSSGVSYDLHDEGRVKGQGCSAVTGFTGPASAGVFCHGIDVMASCCRTVH